MQPLVEKHDSHRIQVDRHRYFGMSAYFLPELTHFAAGFDAFEDKDRVAMHMFQAFFKQPAIVLLLVQGIEKDEVEPLHVLQGCRKQILIPSDTQVDRIAGGFIESDTGDGGKLRHVFQGDTFQSGCV